MAGSGSIGRSEATSQTAFPPQVLPRRAPTDHRNQMQLAPEEMPEPRLRRPDWKNGVLEIQRPKVTPCIFFFTGKGRSGRSCRVATHLVASSVQCVDRVEAPAYDIHGHVYRVYTCPCMSYVPVYIRADLCRTMSSCTLLQNANALSGQFLW